MGGVIIPVLMTWGLEKYSHRTMLIAWFLAVVILSLPAILFLRGRVAPQPTNNLGTFHFMATPIFFLLQAGNIIQALGNFLPGIYLPSFAKSFGASRLDGAGVLSLYNGASVMGSIFTGYLVDTYHISGFAAAARGIGSIASGPISGGLVNIKVGETFGWPRSYGSMYGVLILFTGSMLVLGGIGSASRGYEILRKRTVRERSHRSETPAVALGNLHFRTRHGSTIRQQ